MDLIIETAHYLSPWTTVQYVIAVNLWVDSGDNIFCCFYLCKRTLPIDFAAIQSLEEFVESGGRKSSDTFAKCKQSYDDKKNFFTVGKAAHYYEFEIVEARLIGEVVTSIVPDSSVARHILLHSLSTVENPVFPDHSLELHGFDEPFHFNLDGSSLGVSEVSTHQVTEISLHQILVELDRARKHPRYGHQ